MYDIAEDGLWKWGAGGYGVNTRNITGALMLVDKWHGRICVRITAD